MELVSSTKKAPKPPPSPSSAVTIPPPAEREPPHIIGPAVKLQEPKPLAQSMPSIITMSLYSGKSVAGFYPVGEEASSPKLQASPHSCTTL